MTARRYEPVEPMSVGLTIAVTSAQINTWIQIAYSMGYKRDEPRKSWTRRERKEALRFAMTRAIENRCAAHYVESIP